MASTIRCIVKGHFLKIKSNLFSESLVCVKTLRCRCMRRSWAFSKLIQYSSFWLSKMSLLQFYRLKISDLSQTYAASSYFPSCWQQQWQTKISFLFGKIPLSVGILDEMIREATASTCRQISLRWTQVISRCSSSRLNSGAGLPVSSVHRRQLDSLIIFAMCLCKIRAKGLLDSLSPVWICKDFQVLILFL